MLRDHPPSEPWRREAPRDSTYYSVLRMAGRPMAFPPRHCLPPRLSSPSCLLRQKTGAQRVRSSIFGFSYIIVIMTWLLDVQLPSSWELPMVTTPSMRHLHRLTVLSYVPYCYSFNTRPYIPNNPLLTSLINKHDHPGQTSPYTNQWTFNRTNLRGQAIPSVHFNRANGAPSAKGGQDLYTCALHLFENTHLSTWTMQRHQVPGGSPTAASPHQNPNLHYQNHPTRKEGKGVPVVVPLLH